MKQSIAALILLFTIGICAQNIQEGDVSSYRSSPSTSSSLATTTFSDDFITETKSRNIKSKTFRNFNGEDNGHYIISGVYSNKRNTRKSVKKFTKEGFNAGSLTDSSTGLNYVYI